MTSPTVADATRMKWGKLSTKTRENLPKGDFALPGKGDGPKGTGSGSYPIPDAKHARLALAYGAKNASPSQLSTIKEKVHKKFPTIGRLKDAYKQKD